MSFVPVNQKYEKWLRRKCRVDEGALCQKHERMTKDAFTFLRATFFRWAGQIEDICKDLATSPAVSSVGDLHLENFGTWRDREGRLVWGINDFDEAAVIPYAFDLVRLAASACLAPGLTFQRHHSAAILAGYRRGLKHPRPTLLDEDERWMRPFVACSDHERNKFWRDIDHLLKAVPPDKAKEALEGSLPKGRRRVRFAARVAGGGSLGRPRYVAIADWNGGQIVREAKALVTSAWDWSHSRGDTKPRFLALSTGRYRSPDPFLDVQGKWIVRRIAPDARKVDIGEDFEMKLVGPLFDAMGFDLGSVHAADRSRAREIQAHLDGQEAVWLYDAARAAAAAVEADYREWCRETKTVAIPSPASPG